MAKGKRKSKYDKAREKAYRYYFQRWRGNEKITPAFGQKIRVTRSGGSPNFSRAKVFLFSNDSFVRRLPLYADAIMGSGSSPSPQLV